MKTITKIIIVAAIALFAAVKLFGGGAVSGGFAKNTTHVAPTPQVDFIDAAAQAQKKLMDAARSGNAKQLRKIIEIIKKENYAMSGKILFQKALDTAIVGGHNECVTILAGFIFPIHAILPQLPAEITELIVGYLL